MSFVLILFNLTPAESGAWLFCDLTPIEQQASFSCGFVTVHVDIDEALLEAFSLYWKTRYYQVLQNTHLHKQILT